MSLDMPSFLSAALAALFLHALFCLNNYNVIFLRVYLICQ